MRNKIKAKLKSRNFISFISFFSVFSALFLIMTLIIAQVLKIGIYTSSDQKLQEAARQPETYISINAREQSLASQTQDSEMIIENITETINHSSSSLASASSSSTSSSSTETSSSKDDSSSSTETSSSKTSSESSSELTEPSSSAYSPGTEVESAMPTGSETDIYSGTEPKSKKPFYKPDTMVSSIFYNKDGELLYLTENDRLYQLADLFNMEMVNALQSLEVPNSEGGISYFRYIVTKAHSEQDPDIAYIVYLLDVSQTKETNTVMTRIVISVMICFWILSVWTSYYLAIWINKPIKESYEKQKDFVENASHELRTPLAVLQNRLEALFRNPDSTIIDNSENIALSLDEVRNMRLLTSNLLDLARRDDGIKVQLEDIDPGFFIDLCNNFEIIAEENLKEFTRDGQLTSSFRTDPTLLKQLMTILFDNAIKYTDEDGEIQFSIKQKDNRLEISVSDNGPGISNEDKKKIFDRFYRVDKARTRQKGGFGLGLSLAKQIAAALNGNITVKDNDPKGTIFTVHLTAMNSVVQPPFMNRGRKGKSS